MANHGFITISNAGSIKTTGYDRVSTLYLSRLSGQTPIPYCGEKQIALLIL
jgi:hypothetical protein